MASTNTFAPILFYLGPLPIGETVVTTWALLLVIFVISWLSTRRLKLEPGPWQVALEGIVGAIEDAVEAVLPEYAMNILPFVASLWIFLVLANLIGIIQACMLPRAIYPRRPLWASWFFFRPLVRRSDPWAQTIFASLYRAQPHIAAVSHRQRNLTHRGSGGASIRQHFQPGDGSPVGSAGSRISGARAGIIAAYRRGFGASREYRDAGIDLYCRWNPVFGA